MLRYERQRGAAGQKHFVRSRLILLASFDNSCPGTFHPFSLVFILLIASRLVYPVRNGEHSNSAFGLALALDYTKLVYSPKYDDNKDTVAKMKTIQTLVCCLRRLFRSSLGSPRTLLCPMAVSGPPSAPHDPWYAILA